jgi:hypothetical protein
MRYFLVGVLGATLLTLQPGMAAAQCVGGTAVAGYFRGDGSYVSGGCATTNPFTPGQFSPASAVPTPGGSSVTGVTAPGAPSAAVASGENRARPGRAEARGAPTTRLLPAGDPTGAYGTSLAAATAPPAAGSAELVVAGDSTGAYGTSLPAGTTWRADGNPPLSAGSE